MDVTALGGPHDGDTIAIPDGIRSIRFQVLSEQSMRAMFEGAELDAVVDSDEVAYQVVRWYTGRDDTGEAGRMLMVVIAPDHWPKAGPDRPLYPPEWGHR